MTHLWRGREKYYESVACRASADAVGAGQIGHKVVQAIDAAGNMAATSVAELPVDVKREWAVFIFNADGRHFDFRMATGTWQD